MHFSFPLTACDKAALHIAHYHLKSGMPSLSTHSLSLWLITEAGISVKKNPLLLPLCQSAVLSLLGEGLCVNPLVRLITFRVKSRPARIARPENINSRLPFCENGAITCKNNKFLSRFFPILNH